MKRIVDVVNFNGDASCLSSQRWLDILQEGSGSLLSTWLKLYVDMGKKVVLGFPGATVVDIASHNPEAIELINRHPDIFEIILRPFAHDIALLRLGNGFLINVDYGRKCIVKEFKNISSFFLSPEFMLTNEQIAQLQELCMAGVFINPSRFSADLKRRIPDFPYSIRGLLGATMPCISFRGKLTNCYLHAIQMFDCAGWNAGIREAEEELVFVWRDGESSFLLPDGLDRENHWLHHEDTSIKRVHTMDLELNFVPNDQLEEHHYHSYPVHSFLAWMKELRMIGFISRIQRIEKELDRLSPEQVYYWLLSINSDILSAVEKRSPEVHMKQFPDSDTTADFVIQRSERGFEGEEYLAILEKSLAGDSLPEYVASSTATHMIKWRKRMEYLNAL